MSCDRPWHLRWVDWLALLAACGLLWALGGLAAWWVWRLRAG